MPPRSALLPSEVFLSHSSQDRAFVKKLAKVLERHGVPFWYSATHILGAQEWHDEIGKALARCDWFLLVLSPHSVKSKWVKRELIYALEVDRYKERILPVLRKPCDHEGLSWTLAGFQFVDFSGDFDKACRLLLRRWGQTYRRA
jgi:hypothetical protein